MNRFSESKAKYNRNICIKTDKQEAYYSDPLNFCKYSKEFDVRFIFDIALGRKGVYSTVIEVVDTSPVKKDKIRFCEEQGIDMIIVKWEEVIKSRMTPRHFKAETIFWNGIPNYIRKENAS